MLLCWWCSEFSSLTVSLDQFISRYAFTVFFFPFSPQGFATQYLKVLENGSTKWKRIYRPRVSDLYFNLNIYCSSKVSCIMYLIFSRSTWTREIWLESTWVDLFDNKFGNHIGDAHRSDFFCFFISCIFINPFASL